jgi:hypothetical protein
MDELLTYAVVLYSLIVAYTQFMIMLMELKIMYVYCIEIYIYCIYTVHIYSTHPHVH